MRYLLDTCVVSELSKEVSDSVVGKYLAQIDSRLLSLSVVTIGEIQKGCSLRPIGRKRQELEQWLGNLESIFHSRIVPIDQDTAHIWGELVARILQQGHNLSVPDTLIAATAIQHGMHVVTRNVKDFGPTGVLIVNPWQDDPQR